MIRFKELRGQERALGRLRSLLTTRRLPPALLFAGPPGVGKASAALEFAKALQCEAPTPDACGLCPSCAASDKGLDADVARVDAAVQAGLLGEEVAKQRSIKVETIRHVVSRLSMSSLGGRWKVAVVEDAHLLVTEASNAMLKALEEPPPRTLWILVTHQSERLLGTIRSRCQKIPFSPLKPALVAALLEERGVPAAEAKSLAAMAEGSIGRALALRESPLPDPASWLGDPMAPVRLAEELPKELHLSRPLVEGHLLRMAWHIRGKRGPAAFASSEARDALRGLSELRRALHSNADPRLVLQLAAMGLERLSPGARA